MPSSCASRTLVQHHVHTLDASGKRRPLKACLAKGTTDTCKAHYPKDDLLTDNALVLCPGVAKARGLRTSGQHNATGLITGPRNDPWRMVRRRLSLSLSASTLTRSRTTGYRSFQRRTRVLPSRLRGVIVRAGRCVRSMVQVYTCCGPRTN